MMGFSPGFAARAASPCFRRAKLALVSLGEIKGLVDVDTFFTDLAKGLSLLLLSLWAFFIRAKLAAVCRTGGDDKEDRIVLALKV